jgi:hypothetical protein
MAKARRSDAWVAGKVKRADGLRSLSQGSEAHSGGRRGSGLLRVRPEGAPTAASEP